MLALFLCRQTFAQNEAKYWYFGFGAALDFTSTTNAPAVLANSSMSVAEGCATMSGPTGNLLFYTDGITLWTSTHTVMANGTGLLGNNSPSQSSIIIRKPGSTILYYVFTLQGLGGTAGLNYSIVDMSLSSGQGSVTAKNVPLYAGSCCEKLTATKHCNGVDYWIAIRELVSFTTAGNFRSYVLTPAGVTTVAVVSTATTLNNASYGIGCMKISPNGKKLLVANYNSNVSNSSIFDLFDYDNSTGVVSNSVCLMASANNTVGYGYGVEFSPDGSKAYGSKLYNNINNNQGIYQWDLCAGSAAAIVASQTYIATQTQTNSSNLYGSMQLAPNGKIYVARWYGTIANSQSISVIHNPNVYGAGCNFVDFGQSIGSKWCYYGLPNFPGSYFNQPPTVPPFTYTASNSLGCQTALFNAPLVVQNFTLNGCASSGYSLTGLQWNFGDPASGSANTSTLTNPSHAFTNLGTYTTALILYYSCGGGTDTIRSVVTLTQSCISVSSSSITCASLGSATVTNQGVGPYSYTWMPSGQTGSVATGLSPGTYTLSVYDFGNNFTYTTTTTFNSLIPLTGNLNTTSNITCNGASTGTAGYTNIAGGSSTQKFLWSNGSSTFTAASPTVLSAGLWSVTVTDSLTGCLINDVFFISQPPALTLNISTGSPTACVGTTIALSGLNSGGTPGYTYSWIQGPATDSFVVMKYTGGTYIYTLTSKDSYSCPVSTTVAVDFVNSPGITVSNASICPLQTGTITASGAGSYTWNTSTSTASLAGSPTITTQYTVLGTALGCTSQATGSIFLKPLPVINFSSNNPVCNGQTLTFAVSGGTAATWTGPLSFTSTSPGNSLGNAAPANSGAYNVTLTGANSCTSSSSYTLTVNPTPTVTASGGALCVNQTINLTSASVPGAGFLWTGPNSFASPLQNPSLTNPVVAASGNYTAKVTSAAGCTNLATANITVTPLPLTLPLSDSPKCAGATLGLNGSNTSGGIGYTWSGPNGFSSPLQSPVIPNVTAPAAGIYTLFVSAGPCVVSKTIAVIIHALPTPTAQSNSPVCELKKVLFTAFTPSPNIGTYAWSGPQGYLAFTQGPGRDSSALAHSGVYTLAVTDFNGCKASTTVSVAILANPVLSTGSSTVCLQQPASIAASGAASYAWFYQGVGFANTATAGIASANNPVGTPYVCIVIGTAANGCTAQASASVTTLKLPQPAIVVDPAPKQCLGSEFIFKGSGGTFYEWKGPVNIGTTGSTLSIKATNMALAGTYSLTVYDSKGCKGTTATGISIAPLPGGYLSSSITDGCAPFCSDLNFHPALNTGTLVSQSWQMGRSGFSQGSFPLCFTAPGDYVVSGRVVDSFGCAGLFSTTIKAWPPPVAGFKFDPAEPGEDDAPLVFESTSTGEKLQDFNWYFMKNLPTDHGEVVSHAFNEPGLYPVVLVVGNAWGCSDTLVKMVKIEPRFNIYIPNAFSPNGDGKNEVFMPVMRNIKLYNFKVFNRWGQLLFESSDPTLGWNGTFNGDNCQEGAYIWQIALSTAEGEQKEYKGHVTLLR